MNIELTALLLLANNRTGGTEAVESGDDAVEGDGSEIGLTTGTDMEPVADAEYVSVTIDAFA